jgi:AraC family transcriptional regulator
LHSYTLDLYLRARLPDVLQSDRLAGTDAVEIARFVHPPGEPHEDPEEEAADGLSVNIVERGCFEIEFEAGRIQLSPGDVFVARPGTFLRFRHAMETPDDVCLSISFFDSREEAGRGGPLPSVRRASNRLRYLHGRLAEAERDDALTLECRAVELLEAVGEPPAPFRLYGSRQLRWYAERMDEARETLERRFDDALSLAALARQAGMSPFHFARVFRDLVGRPPHRYLVDVRLSRAAERLREGMSVTETCYATGFRNLSHFVRSFGRRFGSSPSAYAQRAT